MIFFTSRTRLFYSSKTGKYIKQKASKQTKQEIRPITKSPTIYYPGQNVDRPLVNKSKTDVLTL